MRIVGHIDLPAHRGPGGFDHAAIHHRAGHLYVALTANDAVDVIDCARERHVGSIENLPGVAGVLVSEERGLAFTSNRGEDTVGIFPPGPNGPVVKVAVGRRPNGLAFDAGRGTLLAANVGDPAVSGSCTLSVVDVQARAMRAAIPVAGMTRWAIHDAGTDCFFVNIAEPAAIVVIAASDPTRIVKTYEVTAAGPHGLDLDAARGRLYCACDAGQLVALDAASGQGVGVVALSGAPDVIFLDATRERLYVAVGDPRCHRRGRYRGIEGRRARAHRAGRPHDCPRRPSAPALRLSARDPPRGRAGRRVVADRIRGRAAGRGPAGPTRDRRKRWRARVAREGRPCRLSPGVLVSLSHGPEGALARQSRRQEATMPFVNIRIYEGWGKERKDEIASRVTDAIQQVTNLPREAVWVVIEEVDPPDWYVAGKPGERMKA